MSLHGAQTKEPLIRMVKRDTMPQKKAWGIRAAAFILSLVTGGIVDPHEVTKEDIGLMMIHTDHPFTKDKKEDKNGEVTA